MGSSHAGGKNYNSYLGIAAEPTQTQITLSQDVSLCYTPGTAFVDADGNPLPLGTHTSASGTTSGLNYRIYGTNSNNLDVYYLYDSKHDNPDRVPASVADSEGGFWEAGEGPSKGTFTAPYGVVTYCDIELHYGLYGN